MTDERPPVLHAETSFFAGEWGATPENVVTARHEFSQWLKDIALIAGQAQDILLAVSEAVTNAMEHGSRFDATLLVSLQATLHGESLTVTVNDHGHWIEPSDQPLTTSQHRGRGLHLINELAFDVSIAGSAQGTQIIMRFDLASQTEPPVTGDVAEPEILPSDFDDVAEPEILASDFDDVAEPEILASDFDDQSTRHLARAIGAEVDLPVDTTEASAPQTVSDVLPPSPPACPDQPAIGDAAPA
jgi:anti-sigma regulatory factor (Ser/Thr protein kinase)